VIAVTGPVAGAGLGSGLAGLLIRQLGPGRALAAAERLDPAEALEFARELRALLPDR
jgi:hypothetical protein